MGGGDGSIALVIAVGRRFLRLYECE